MRLVLIGCEYSGKTTLATEISRWMIDAMSLPLVRWHNHFVAPHLDRHMVVWANEVPGLRAPGKQPDEEYDADELDQVMALKPSLLEQFQRHSIWRHLHQGNFRDEHDWLVIDAYYADAVYAPLYYGYGEPGSFSDRRRRAREWDKELLASAPDTVLVLVKAGPEIIARRLKDKPKPRNILKPQDIEHVLRRFQEEYDDSLVMNKFSLDTTSAGAGETREAFLDEVWPYLTQEDRLRITTPRRHKDSQP